MYRSFFKLSFFIEISSFRCIDFSNYRIGELASYRSIEASKHRDFEISYWRAIEVSSHLAIDFHLYSPRAVALGVVGTAPEGFALVGALADGALHHWRPALGATWSTFG